MQGIKTCNHRPSDVNYLCIDKNCQLFLCNFCVNNHKKIHNNIKLVSDLQKLYGDKIKESINSFRYELEKLEDYKEEAFDTMQLEEGLKIIQVAKDDLIRSIKRYFKEVKEKFELQMDISTRENIDNFDQIKSKINTVMDNLNLLFSNLNDPKSDANIQISILSIMHIDYSYEVKRYNSMIKGLTNNLFDFSINHNVIDEIITRLPDYIVANIKGQQLDINKSGFSLENNFNKNVPLANTITPTKANVNASPYLQESFKKLEILPMSHSSFVKDTSKPIKDFTINMDDYFIPEVESRHMHFFEGGTKNLYLVQFNDITKQGSIFSKIELNNIFNVPLRHRSITTPEGEIYLIGGVESNKELKNCYKMSFDKIALESKSMMIVSRKSYGICYMNGYIYAIGGANHNEGFLKKCERYDVLRDIWTIIADLGESASSPCVCSFRNMYLYKFGGLAKHMLLNNKIEKYDVEKNIWTTYDVENITEDIKNFNFRLLWLSGCCQINYNQIYVFGGCENNDLPSNTSFLFEVIEKEQSLLKAEFKIKRVNAIELPTKGGFWNNQVIINDSKIYCLQNLAKDSKEAYEDKRNSLMFDGEKWYFNRNTL